MYMCGLKFSLLRNVDDHTRLAMLEEATEATTTTTFSSLLHGDALDVHAVDFGGLLCHRIGLLRLDERVAQRLLPLYPRHFILFVCLFVCYFYMFLFLADQIRVHKHRKKTHASNINTTYILLVS